MLRIFCCYYQHTQVESSPAPRGNQLLQVSHSSFSANCFAAVHRKETNGDESFHCKDLVGHIGHTKAIEFSKDGTLLASGGTDKIVRLWPIGNSATIAPTEMKTKHESAISSLAIYSENNRLFSGAADGKIFIHDIQT